MNSNKYSVYIDPGLEDLIPDFLNGVYSDIKQILEYVNMAEYEKIVPIAQKIKGDGGGYGFEKITQLGRAVEMAAKNIDSDQIMVCIHDLSDYLEKVEVRYDFKNMIILCVDDDKHSLDLTKRLLAGKEHDVITAKSGMAALQLLETIRPQLILLDVIMPEMDGYEVCERLQGKKDTANIPVIFLTALEGEQDKLRAFSYGVVDYIVKPIKKDELYRKVDKHINTISRWKKLDVTLTDEPLSAADEVHPDFIKFKDYLFEKLGLPENKRLRYSDLSEKNVYSIIVDCSIQEEDLTKIMAEYLDLPYVPEIVSDNVQLGILPASFCRSNLVVPVTDDSSELCFLLGNPFAEGIIEKLRKYLRPDQDLKICMTKPDNIWDLSLTAAGR